MSRMKNYIQGGLDLLFPPVCVVCRAPLECGTKIMLCMPCFREVMYLSSPLCTICGVPFDKDTGKDRLCDTCLRKKPSFSLARAVTLYSPPVSVLLQMLKYKGDTSTLKILSELSKWINLRFFANCDLIFPIPLHRRRLRQRGLNQSLHFARIFFPEFAPFIVPDGLVRIRETPTQTGLTAIERRKNLKGAFSIKEQLFVRDKEICLVDDVLTTGSTVEECSKVLLNSGASDVKVLTMARVAKFKH
jgi:ComF family protein